MKIGFLILRDTMLKTLGSLIETSLDHGHIVTLLYDEKSVSGTKAYQRITREKLVFFEELGASLSPVDSSELASEVKNLRLQVLVLLEGFFYFENYAAELDTLRTSGTKIVSLPYFFENSNQPLEALNHFDKSYYLSSFALDTHFFRLGQPDVTETKRRFASRVEITGSPMFDQLVKMKDITRYRPEFGIPDGRKVVVLFSPVINPTTDWRFHLWKDKSKSKRLLRILSNRKVQYLSDAFRTPTFAEILRAIREFCDRNDAFLVVKSRVKQMDKARYEKIADLYISGEDESYYPEFTTYKLLSLADLCISSMSMVVVEAVAANVPAVNIYIPPEEQRTNESEVNYLDYLDSIMNTEHEGPFNFPGCIHGVDKYRAAKWFEHKKIKDLGIDQKARAAYVDRFLGLSPVTSSERVLASIVRLSREENPFRELEPSI
jgi:hypothetical protein